MLNYLNKPTLIFFVLYSIILSLLHSQTCDPQVGSCNNNDVKPYDILKINSFCLSDDCTINTSFHSISDPSYSCFNNSYHLFHDIFINNGKIVLISFTPYVLLRAICQKYNYCGNNNHLCMSLPNLQGDVIKVNKNFRWESLVEFRIISYSVENNKNVTKFNKLKVGKITYDITDIAEPASVTILDHSIIKKKLKEDNYVNLDIRLLNCNNNNNKKNSKYLIRRQYRLEEQIINQKKLTMFTLFSAKEKAIEVKTWLEYYRHYHGVEKFVLFYNTKSVDHPNELFKLLDIITSELDWINQDTLVVAVWPFAYRAYIEGVHNDVNKGGVCFHNAQTTAIQSVLHRMKYSGDDYKWLMLFDFDEFLSFRHNISDVISIKQYQQSYNGIEFWCSWSAVLNMTCIKKKFNNNSFISLIEMNNRKDFKGIKNIRKIAKCLQKQTELFNISDYLNSTIIRHNVKPAGRTKLLLNVNKVNLSTIHYSQSPIYNSKRFFLHMVPHNKLRKLEENIKNPLYELFINN